MLFCVKISSIIGKNLFDLLKVTKGVLSESIQEDIINIIRVWTKRQLDETEKID